MKNLEVRLEALIRKHKDLDQAIQAGYKSYTPDTELKAMKAEKLTIKDEIESIKQLLDSSAAV